MKNLFDKAAVFTDLHLGLKSNSIDHNENCISFIKWMIDDAKAKGCNTCIFMGDYYHFRSSINTLTMNYGIKGLELLNDAFDIVYFMLGNHDLFYRDRRDVNSTKYASLLPNIKFIDNIEKIGDCLFLPWLIDDEWKKVQKYKGKYVFGHLEMPGFYLNSMVQAPDHGQIQSKHFKNFDHVFSGHFHKRQSAGNITYIGNCFPHNFSDNHDIDRGYMVLEWDKKPEFVTWPDQPEYKVVSLSTFVKNPLFFANKNTYFKIITDIEISFEDAFFLKEIMVGNVGVKEMMFVAEPNSQVTEDEEYTGVFKTVNEIVTEELKKVDSNSLSTKKLIEIYTKLPD